jgi:hypothetical protein
VRAPTIRCMDIVAIAMGVAVFAVLFALIYGIERV